MTDEKPKPEEEKTEEELKQEKKERKKKKKKDKLPKGAGRVPEWWLEITPHETLYIEEEEAQRQKEYEEAYQFAKLAAEQDMLDKWGGEGFPNWNPASDGPRTKDEETEWVSKGYKRNEKEEWVDEADTPLEGRQFKGKMPPGYMPGEFSEYGKGAGGGGKHGLSSPSSPRYQSDAGKNWQKPSWMGLKLKSTAAGSALRKDGDAPKGPIVKGSDFKKSAPNVDPSPLTAEDAPEPAESAEPKRMKELKKVGNDKSRESVHEETELQKILQKRLQVHGDDEK